MTSRRHAGFTLPELLIVVTVMAVLMAVGVPSFVDLIRGQRVKTASFDLFSTLTVARNEAITRNTSITITPANSANWANGWTIGYVDGATPITLRQYNAMPNITITGPTTIVYRASGRLNDTAARQFLLTAAGTSSNTRCITVDLSGRPVSKASSC